MRKLTAIAVLAMICQIAIGQTINFNQLKNLKPRNIGPAGMSGRVTAVDAL